MVESRVLVLQEQVEGEYDTDCVQQPRVETPSPDDALVFIPVGVDDNSHHLIVINSLTRAVLKLVTEVSEIALLRQKPVRVEDLSLHLS